MRREWLALAGLVLAALIPAGSARAASGGPDAWGNLWSDAVEGCSISTGSFGPGATTITLTNAMQGPFNLGFSFPFLGGAYTQVWVSPYGFATFSAGQTNSNVPLPIPNTGSPNNMIAVHWAQALGADITVEATPGEFHIRWVQRLSVTVTQESHLFLDRSGRFRMTWRGTADVQRCIGYEDSTGRNGVLLFWDPTPGVPGDETRAPGYPTNGSTQATCISPPVYLDCASALVVDCGNSINGNLPAADPSPATNYSCSPTAYQGNEQVVQVRVPSPQRLTVSIDNPALDILRVDTNDCTELSCTAVHDNTLAFPFVLAGTYTFVVDKAAAGGGDAFRFTANCQDPYRRVSCGDSVAGTTSGLSVFDSYTCSGAALSGPEALHRISLATAQNLVATLSAGSPNHWVVIFEASAFETSGPCLAAGRGGAGVFDAPPGDYVIVVDGASGASGAFTLDIDCGQQLDCSGARPASCATRITGNTSGSPNRASIYSCTTEALTGGEDVWSFVNPVEQTISARFVTSTPGQQVLLVPACDEGECLLAGDSGVSCSLFPPGTYFIIVDGTSSGPYELEISCSEIYTGIDLRVASIDTGVAATDCTTFDVGAVTRVEVANLGDTDAPAGIQVTVFEDRAPLNARYDAGTDNLLGQTTLGAPLPRGQSLTVDVPTTGSLLFRDNVIYAMVDSAGAVAEVLEDNNLFDTGRGCEYRPPVGVFSPIIEWDWSNSPDMPTFVHVDTIPLVADMNMDGIPDVIFVSGDRPGGFGDAVVRVVDGRTGRDIWTAQDPAAYVFASTNLAVGDVTGDTIPEVIGMSNVVGQTDRLVAIDNGGALMWVSDPLVRHPARANGGGAPAIADLDCNGQVEIVYGANVFNSRGTLINAPPDPRGTLGINGATQDGAISIPVDIDGDGRLEVVAGPTAYRFEPAGTTMTQIWRNASVPDGYPAAGNFDDDPLPEIAITADGTMYLLEGDTGALIWQRQIPRGGGGCNAGSVAGGPPTIADFDGDCSAEVGVSGADWYVVFETDGTVKWQAPINDCSSHRTASTVFDFDGDGAAEVAFADQTLLHVFSGSDGTEITNIPTASHTWTEMVSVADVDADNNAEIIMGMNSGAGLRGIRVVGDSDDNWVNTRRIWNQHQYHINNVNDDGTIPGPFTTGSCELPAHRLHNTYRDQLGSAVYAAPDITISLTSYDIELVNEGGTCRRQVRIQARVGNGGGISVGQPFTAWFWKDDGAGGRENIASQAIADLQPGEYVDFEVVVPDPGVGSIDIYAVADDDGAGGGAINECREDNNVCVTTVDNAAIAIDPPLPLGPALRVTNHTDPRGATISADLVWTGDLGLPRPAGDHYHVKRSLNDRGQFLTRLAGIEPYAGLTYTDTTPASGATYPPHVHYYLVIPADECEQEAQE